MIPGQDTVTFVSIDRTTGTKSELGIPAPAETPQAQTGCSFQPVTVQDKITDTMFSEATHKCISPTSAITLACEAEDRLEFNGTKHRVIGTKVFRDRRQRVNHITVVCREQDG